MTSEAPSSDLEQLIDPFQREITYLRLSVTDRCNLRCTYCMADDMTFLPKQQVLDFDEMEAIAAVFVKLGIRKIRLTGGEPLARNGIVGLVESLSALEGLDELVMTTNGILLPRYARALKDAGMGRVNISLDTLDPERYRAMTRVGELQDALAGISAAQRENFGRIKLNTVVLAGVNDDETLDLARFAVDNGMDLSFIEEMPLGWISSHERGQTQVASERIREELHHHFDMVPSDENTGGPSRYLRVKGSGSKIGFISPMTDNFCSSCNRVRLTVEGRLLLCLGNEDSANLRDLIRRHPGDSERLRRVIEGAIARKPERHYFDPDHVDIVRFMNATGG
ncbi:GTP 3',8-cyclase MoaA [Kineobactrum salinum]|uniref:GTP 3',8-cyclase n=1 Tax=Kineobactrum salinum TaxID=2708301 RepID=A0A6C0U1W7_9GAMM|nr:GTP 3',8-cyclase MoaA [Kineobactrum salinum]QIB65908.1 GTP 3',8-cyclase MoaA [Kineobactrum salinum]